MNIGPLELWVLLVSMLAPLIAGVYLATRLNKRRGAAQPPSQVGGS